MLYFIRYSKCQQKMEAEWTVERICWRLLEMFSEFKAELNPYNFHNTLLRHSFSSRYYPSFFRSKMSQKHISGLCKGFLTKKQTDRVRLQREGKVLSIC